jgi:hypothetical protein
MHPAQTMTASCRRSRVRSVEIGPTSEPDSRRAAEAAVAGTAGIVGRVAPPGIAGIVPLIGRVAAVRP